MTMDLDGMSERVKEAIVEVEATLDKLSTFQLRRIMQFVDGLGKPPLSAKELDMVIAHVRFIAGPDLDLDEIQGTHIVQYIIGNNPNA